MNIIYSGFITCPECNKMHMVHTNIIKCTCGKYEWSLREMYKSSDQTGWRRIADTKRHDSKT